MSIRCFFLACLILKGIALPEAAAQSFLVPGGGSNGIAGSSVAVFDFWALTDNQAGLAKLETSGAGVLLSNNYGISELGVKTVAFAHPAHVGVIGGSYSHTGFANWNRQNIGLVFARSFSPAFFTGIRLDYFTTGYGDYYGKSMYLGFSIGSIAALTEHCNLGIHISHPHGLYFRNDTGEKFSPVMRAGLQYFFSDKVAATAEAEKQTEFMPCFKTGMEFMLTEQASARIGVTTTGSRPKGDPTPGYLRLTFGAGIKTGKLSGHLNATFHQILGWSPDISLVYVFR